MIDFSLTDCVAQITINRPDRANALSSQMLSDLVQAVAQADGAHALVMTGAGRVFSAGADLDEVMNGGLATDPNWERLSHAVAKFEGLTVACLNGTVAGGAMGMVLACDIRIARDGSSFFYPALAKGVDPQPSDPARCSALIGPSRTAEIFLAGRKVTSADALSWGLVNHVVDEDRLTDAVAKAVAPAQSANLAAIARIKSMISPCSATD